MLVTLSMFTLLDEYQLYPLHLQLLLMKSPPPMSDRLMTHGVRFHVGFALWHVRSQHEDIHFPASFCLVIRSLF